jgi:bifunctional DNA-binding transcriptional regulator/antitoxin component of YhaV-PrlF toxin-antitoxin module
MNQTITITPRWQIHLPVKFRQVLGLTAPGLVEIKLVKRELILKPKTSPLLKLAGKYRHQVPTKKINLEKVRDQIDYSGL